MKSVTLFLRRKGVPVREIRKLLLQLEATGGHAAATSAGGDLIEVILEQLKNTPLCSPLWESRKPLEETGIEPHIQYGHTLKIPLSRSEGGPQGQPCFTRVSQGKWVFQVQSPDDNMHRRQPDRASPPPGETQRGFLSPNPRRQPKPGC